MRFLREPVATPRECKDERRRLLAATRANEETAVAIVELPGGVRRHACRRCRDRITSGIRTRDFTRLNPARAAIQSR